MEPDLLTLNEQTAKLSIDPVYDTNWCDVPNEIKVRCLEKLKFRERLNMRATSKLSKCQIDSLKYKFTFALFTQKFDGFYKLFSILLGSNREDMLSNLKETTEWMKYILKIGVFDRLIFNFDKFDANVNLTSGVDELIDARSVDFMQSNPDFIIAMLKNLKPIDSFLLNANSNPHFPLDKILGELQVQQARFIEILNLSAPHGLQKVAQMWIDKDSKVGNLCHCSSGLEDSLASFVNWFNNSIIYRTGRTVRIRIPGSSKNILLDFYETNELLGAFRMVYRMEIVLNDYNDSEEISYTRLEKFLLEFRHQDSDAREYYESDEEEDGDFEYNEFGHRDYGDAKEKSRMLMTKMMILESTKKRRRIAMRTRRENETTSLILMKENYF
ncbi:hypothetical protein B9Z55_024825 [Caenorhabditis nigoni]|uniref:F-box domain-containing protein n=1 Tax=Caenorhabditis nigoni TaxID=1611254 RepID=A0A2G5SVP9_9PELO|nr:hypothetical protein B9Z55_024825 [Caenorhabditis nigoni]